MKAASLLLLVSAAALGACGNYRPAFLEPLRGAVSSVGSPAEDEKAPSPAVPVDEDGRRAYEAAKRVAGKRILVSIQDRWLWLIEGEDTLLAAPVAVGKGEEFEFRGKRWFFETPQGARRVLGKAENPNWVPPEWHYFEIAKERDLDPVFLRKGQRVSLTDGTTIEVRGREVGRMNTFGNFWPFTPGKEIIFDGKIFIPPIGTDQREVPLTLGTHKLELGDGYLIHGTDQPDSVGSPVSHGCVRMRNEDVAELYAMVPVGTPVFIY